MTPQDRPFTLPGDHASLRWIVGILGILATAAFVPSTGLAREDAGEKMSFDLHADAAERSLKQFSAQSGLEVLFVSEAAANVRTNAIKGAYTPRDAIDRMLAGTKLAAVHEEKTGAVRIISAASANGQSRAADATPNSQPPAKKKTSKP